MTVDPMTLETLRSAPLESLRFKFKFHSQTCHSSILYIVSLSHLFFFLRSNRSKRSLVPPLKISTMYSVSKTKSDRKPPLAKSPMRLRPCRILRPSNSCSLQTPSGTFTEFKKPVYSRDIEKSELEPISCELRALTKMAQEESRKENPDNNAFANICSVNSEILFERGRFYDEYSARRNERLKRKKGVTADDGKASVYNLGVTVESTKKNSSKKVGNLRKSVSTAYEPSETPRYMLRSMTKGNKKPPLPSNFDKSIFGGDKKIRAPNVRRI